MPFSDSSHTTMEVFVKSSGASTGSMHMASLSSSKDLLAFGVHENASRFSNFGKGASIHS